MTTCSCGLQKESITPHKLVNWLQATITPFEHPNKAQLYMYFALCRRHATSHFGNHGSRHPALPCHVDTLHNVLAQETTVNRPPLVAWLMRWPQFQRWIVSTNFVVWTRYFGIRVHDQHSYAGIMHGWQISLSWSAAVCGTPNSDQRIPHFREGMHYTTYFYQEFQPMCYILSPQQQLKNHLI